MYFKSLKLDKYSKRIVSPVFIKEIKLPFSSETHEILYEPVTNSVFVSQMSNSVLVQIDLDENGILKNVDKCWTIAKESSGLHNLSLSYKYPGCVWASLQFNNKIILFDAKTKKIIYDLITPDIYIDSDKKCFIGGPHCIRECKNTGILWVALKGNIGCCPDVEISKKKKDVLRKCCNLSDIRKSMEIENISIPDGYAIWKINPELFDKTIENGYGGNLFDCLPSPPMMTIDTNSNCWVSLDCSSVIMKITIDNKKSYIDVPHCSQDKLCITGPAIVSDPLNNTWLSLLGANGCLVKIHKYTEKKTLYKISVPDWIKDLKIIHFTFDDLEKRLFAISSDLLEEKSVNAVIILKFDDNWEIIKCQRIIPLPTQDCSCHRIELIENKITENRSIVVSEMSSSKIFQMQISNITDYAPLQEKKEKIGEYVYKTYINLPEINGLRV